MKKEPLYPHVPKSRQPQFPDVRKSSERMEEPKTESPREQAMAQLLNDLVEARDKLTVATRVGVELDRNELWKCAEFVREATEYAGRIYREGDSLRVVKRIGEHHATKQPHRTGR